MKTIKILCCILGVLVLGLIIMLITNNNDFNKPSFESNVIKVKDSTQYEDKLLTIRKGYSFYIDGAPEYKNNNLHVNFYSNSDESIYLKVRVLKDDKVIGESGLIKTGELLKSLRIKNLKVNDELTYLIMGYEKDTYYSAGELKLNVKVGESHEE